VAPDGSITGWIDPLKAGDPQAAQVLWDRFFRRLVALARKKLQSANRRTADEEDIALSAFASLCRGAEAGRFPKLGDRDNLWRVLALLTARKAWHLMRDAHRAKRSAPEPSVADTPPSAAQQTEWHQFLSREPNPAFAAQMEEEYRLLLGRLADRELETIAVWKLEGYTNEEIAAKLDCTMRTVERKVRIIRGIWQREACP
jgi:DNA-directed RNA polymerase specialized sigma24 family protein